MFKRLKAVLVGIKNFKMSAEQVKQIDHIVNWSFKTIWGLAAFAMAAMYYSVTGDVHSLMQKAGSTDSRLMRIETQLEDRADNDKRRDKAIEDIQKALNERKR